MPMNTHKHVLDIWKVLILTVTLLPLFMLFIPYWIRHFDRYLPGVPFGFGYFRYIGIILFLGALFFCLYSIFFLTIRAGGMPIDRVIGGTPPRLVIAGPYRFVRNPQQLGNILMLWGLTIYFESLSILIYTLIVTVLSHTQVVMIEEPGLRNRFGAEYEYYCKVVPRWIPKIGGKARKP
ncbi:MAG: methyltransferase family protein [Candidatus Heimdallarchaeota archaeon]